MEKMHQPIDWPQEIYFGKAPLPEKPPTKYELQSMALVNFNYIRNNLKPRNILVVAALYAPGKGIFLGTIPGKKTGAETRFKKEAESFTKLWEKLKLRTKKHENNSIYYAEDAAILYVFKNGAIRANDQFPTGSKMGVFWLEGVGRKP